MSTFFEEFLMLYSFEDHYKKLGYYYNPFREYSRADFLKIFPSGNFIKEMLHDHFQILQIIGGSGFGKSTVLVQIFAYLQETGQKSILHYVKNRTDLPDLQENQAGWILLDEAQRIRKDILMPRLHQWLNSGIRFVLGSHMDHEAWFCDIPRKKTFYLSRYNKQHIQSIWETRLQVAAIDKPMHIFSQEAFDALLTAGQGSLMIARMISYELFIGSNLPGTINGDLVAKAADTVYNSMIQVMKAYE